MNRRDFLKGLAAAGIAASTAANAAAFALDDPAVIASGFEPQPGGWVRVWKTVRGSAQHRLELRFDPPLHLGRNAPQCMAQVEDNGDATSTFSMFVKAGAADPKERLATVHFRAGGMLFDPERKA